MRGKQRPRKARLKFLGLIPAHAGKTGESSRGIGVASAHPRACGENTRQAIERTRIPGSSPRMRGKPSPCGMRGAARGLIPAHAGKTAQAGNQVHNRGAHPRACGENVVPRALAGVTAGSSPRMRGKLVRTPGLRVGEGLIPAHAGKTSQRARRWYWSRAHPRACGENSRAMRATSAPSGSSPRMRGKQPRNRTDTSRFGLIPAHAGKTSSEPLSIKPMPAHPRACGENVRSARSV